MTPVLLDLSICAEALAQRPKRLLEKFRDNQDTLHISAITASELYKFAMESFSPENVAEAMGEIDRFIGRFQWVDADFHTIRKAAMYETPDNTPDNSKMSYQTEWNIRLARANGLVYVGSKEVDSEIPVAARGVQIEFW